MRLSRSLLAVAGVGGGMYMLGSIMRSGVTEAAAFERQMANVSTMLDDQSMQLLPRYTQQLRAMSVRFGEGTETLSKGLYDILSASIAPSAALDVLAVSTKAASSGITDTGVAADAITTILNSYSLSADKAGEISDKLFSIVIRGKTTFAELAPNIGKIAALAATAGESFDDLGATLATMTRAGVRTEIAVTSLRAIILSFLKPQSDSVEAARKYGIELNSQTLRTIGLIGVIQKLKKATAEELAVIVPTSRAITGFAAAVQKAEALGGDYEFMLNSLGNTEKAYQKIADTSAFKLDQMNQQWIEFKRTIGDVVIPILISVFEHMNAAAGGGKFKALMHENIAVMYEFADALTNLDELFKAVGAKGWDKTYAELAAEQRRLAAEARVVVPSQPIEEPTARLEISESAMAKIEAMNRYTQAAQGPAAMTAKEMAQIVADTREKLASIRAMDDLTRMEKIQNLQDYAAEHAETLSKVTDAEKLINDEIIALQQSRRNAMKVYSAELREDMQNLSLYISEQFADASRSMESALSNSFQSMIRDGMSWRDATIQFLTEVRNAFIKMVADMVARAAAKSFIEPLMSGLLGTLTGGIASNVGGGYAAKQNAINVAAGEAHGGGRVGAISNRRWVDSSVFDSAPKFHDLRPGETAIIAQNDEVISRPGLARGMGSPAPSVIINNYTGQNFESQGPSFDGERWVVGIVARNMKQGGGLKKMMRG